MTRPKFSSSHETLCCLCLKDAGKQSRFQGVFLRTRLAGKRGQKKAREGQWEGKNRNYLQFPIESNRKLKILKFISFISFLEILRVLTSFFFLGHGGYIYHS